MPLCLVLSACAQERPPESAACHSRCPELRTCRDALCALSGARACRVEGARALPPQADMRPLPYPAGPSEPFDGEPPPSALAVTVRPIEVPEPAPVEVGDVAEPVTDPEHGTPLLLRIWPGHAVAHIDGAPVPSSRPIHLAPGPHAVSVNDPCCEPYAGTIEVSAAADRVQVVALTLQLRPAIVTLVNAPESGVAVCNGIVLLPRSETTVSLSELSEVLTCVFHPGEASRSITVQAGHVTAVPW
jgi:hypothetical protein